MQNNRRAFLRGSLGLGLGIFAAPAICRANSLMKTATPSRTIILDRMIVTPVYEECAHEFGISTNFNMKFLRQLANQESIDYKKFVFLDDVYQRLAVSYKEPAYTPEEFDRQFRGDFISKKERHSDA